MELTIILFLFGRLFLGWSLGANDARSEEHTSELQSR